MHIFSLASDVGVTCSSTPGEFIPQSMRQMWELLQGSFNSIEWLYNPILTVAVTMGHFRGYRTQSSFQKQTNSIMLPTNDSRFHLVSRSLGTLTESVLETASHSLEVTHASSSLSTTARTLQSPVVYKTITLPKTRRRQQEAYSVSS